MSKIYLNNRLDEEHLEIIRNTINSFFSDQGGDIFEGTLDISSETETRVPWGGDECSSKEIAVACTLRLDVRKTNPTVTALNPLEEVVYSHNTL